jgi:hypothetical protein
MTYYSNLDYGSDLNRLDFARFIRPSEAVFSSHDSFFFNKIQSLKKVGEFRVVSEAGRPDIISVKIYGSYNYWWILMLYNKYVAFADIKIGDVIEYPALDSIERLYYGVFS